MSYIVTARKWRPQLFRDLISQSHVTDTLKNAIKTERVGHAYLFTGPRGVGKTTVARIFAKALNCIHGPAEEPCNECENCIGIQSGTSLDVQELDGASNNSVEDARNLIATIGYHASKCRYKIYIIDEVHMLTKEAFNALLKTLEEPPPNVIFIFATTEPRKILPTILSRCQRFDFRRLTPMEIAGKLKKIAEADSIDIDESSLMLIAQRASGAMRDAESILEQIKSSHAGHIDPSDISRSLGIADRDIFFDIIESCRDREPKKALGLFRQFYDEGGDLKEFAEGLLGHLRDLLYAKYEGGIEEVILTEAYKERLKIQSGWFEQGDILRMIGYITEVETSLPYAIIPVLKIETALVRMALLESTIQLRELLEKFGGASEVEDSTQNNAPRNTVTRASLITEQPAVSTSKAVITETAEIKKPEPVRERESSETDSFKVAPDIDSIRVNWKEIMSRLIAIKPSIGPSLSSCSPESFENDTLTVSMPGKDAFHLKVIESQSESAADVISSFLGCKIKLKIIRNESGSGNEVSSVKNKGELEDMVQREPIIKEVLEKFDGEINDTWRLL